MEFSQELVSSLRKVRRVTVLTGAGISAESGIPTFRDAQSGLWTKYRPEDLATPEAFQQNPGLVWDWYGWRKKLVAEVQPNPGHEALAEMERYVVGGKPGAMFTLVTQNVDGLHQRAGSRNVIELHGNLLRSKCFEENVVVEEWVETGEVPPRCPRCGGLLRPDVVWFGEMLPHAELEKACQAARGCEIFFSVGTSALVQPAASLPYLAQENGAVVVEVNPASTPLTRWVNHILAGPAGTVLPELVRIVWMEDDKKT